MSKAEVICLKEYYFLIFDDKFSNTSHIIKNKKVHFWIMQSYKKNFSSSNDLIFFNILNTLFQYVFWLHYIFPRLHFQLWHCICMPHNEDTFFWIPLILIPIVIYLAQFWTNHKRGMCTILLASFLACTKSY